MFSAINYTIVFYLLGSYISGDYGTVTDCQAAGH